MTRWSLRRRLGITKDAEGEYQPAAGTPVAGHQQTGSADGQPTDPALTGQSSPGQAEGWFRPGQGWGGQPAPAQPGDGPYGVSDPPVDQYSGGQPSVGRHGTGQPVSGLYNGQYGPGQERPGSGTPGGGLPGGVALLSPAPAAARPAAGPAQPHATLPGAGLSSVSPGGAYSGRAYSSGAASAGVTSVGPARDAWAEAAQAQAAQAQAELPAPRPGGAWPDICDQFGLHLLVLAEQLRTSLDELEADEGDPERLRRLYQVDHAVTRMRRASRDLRTLAGRSEEELTGFTTSLLDVIRMAASAIERYKQVTIGRVTDLAVLGYAADDVGALVAALLDNATRYSPGTVTVSGHLIDDGSVMFRIEDTGIGIGSEQVTTLNTTLAGPVPDVDERTGRHTGFPVVHRIARKHSIGIRLASRPLPSSGTVAMVMIPAHLLCEVPEDETQRRQAIGTQGPGAAGPVSAGPAAPGLPAPRPTALPDWQPRGEPTRPQQAPQLGSSPAPQWEPPELPGDPARAGELPRRERASLRGNEPRPKSTEKAALPTRQQQAAARRAFADDLDAFSLGSAGQPTSVTGADTAEDTAAEGEPQP